MCLYTLLKDNFFLVKITSHLYVFTILLCVYSGLVLKYKQTHEDPHI